MKKIIKNIQQELKRNIDKKYKEGNERFFKEKFICYGVRTPKVRQIAKKYFKEIKDLPKKDIFKLCEILFKNRYNEEATIATQWLSGIKDNLNKKDFIIFKKWIGNYLDNWAKIDDFCLHVIHQILEKYPSLIKDIKKWAFSKNVWLRRASAVSFVTTKGSFYVTKNTLEDIFEIAKILLKDKKDLVQKGYGWMLKSASVFNQKEIFNFVMRHKTAMPRTALRYAIEKMPKKLKKRAMK